MARKSLEITVKVPVDMVKDCIYESMSEWIHDEDSEEFDALRRAESRLPDSEHVKAANAILNDPAFIKAFIKEYTEECLDAVSIQFVHMEKKPKAYKDYINMLRARSPKVEKEVRDEVAEAIELLRTKGYVVGQTITN